jgi:glyoxylase-like metal-dependent hydrolase (beta-lactamase superfamily II)
MNELEHQLIYPLAEFLPEYGTKHEVAPGVFWVRMPLPFALNHINLYLLADEVDTVHGRISGWTLVDCGIASEEIRGYWEQIFETGLDGKPIIRVLCTHMHPDHIGNAAWIVERFSRAQNASQRTCEFWITLGEYAICRSLVSGADPGAAERENAYYQKHGVVDLEALATLRVRSEKYFRSLVPDLPKNYRRIREDEPIKIGGRSFQVIIGTGHSPEHAALYCDQDQLLLAGDMVLPRISTNTSVFEIEPEGNPVRWFMNSLDRYRPCAPTTLTLPSHGKPFRNLHIRLDQLQAHHRDRLAEVAQACALKPCSAMDIVPVMFKRPLDTHQLTFALGESLGHLHALWYADELVRFVDDGGVIRFRPKSVEL